MKVKVGWVGELRRYSPAVQQKSLVGAGVAERKIYDFRWETLADALNDATKGGALYVHRLSAVAKGRAGWRQLTDLLGGRDLLIVETSTGAKLQLSHGAAEMVVGLTDDWAGNRMTAAQARNAGRKGAKARWRHQQRAPIRVAAPIWKNWVEYPRPDDALAHEDMAGWTESTARKYLGKRGAPAGPIAFRED